MSLYYQNVRGLRTKCKLFSENVYKSNYDVIAVTESWLNSLVHSGELFDDRYNVFRRDRETSSSLKNEGGGSMFAINLNYTAMCFRRLEWESNAEDVWVTIIVNNQKIHICCVYIPGDLDINTLEHYYNKIYSIFVDNPDDKFIILGDFNIPQFLSITSGSSISNSKFNLLNDCVNFCGLDQYNNIVNANNRLLDLFFSNIVLKVNSCEDGLVNTDLCHPPLKSTIVNFGIRPNSDAYSYRDFNGADYSHVNSRLLEINWHEILNLSDVPIKCLKFFI